MNVFSIKNMFGFLTNSIIVFLFSHNKHTFKNQEWFFLITHDGIGRINING